MGQAERFIKACKMVQRFGCSAEQANINIKRAFRIANAAEKKKTITFNQACKNIINCLRKPWI